ncbi:MAG: BolA family protein [Xanthomonadaceae bacterium]|nr:BolA family protein [Xanthomonadaceae bacterium]
MSARVEAITRALEAALAPHALEVIDESHKHVGHEGARDGRGHFAVKVVSAAFAGLPPLARHRRIYEALGGLMQTDIHALSIVLAKTPDEADSA